MKAMKNAVHIGILAVWAVPALLISLKLVLALAVVAPLAFWLWFAGFAAVTTAAVRKLDGPVGALLVHAAAFGVLHLVPKVFPLHLLRLGLDFLQLG